MIEVEISDRGVVRVRPIRTLQVKVWSVELVFKSETTRIEEGREKRVEISVRDSIKINKTVRSGEEISVNLGLPISRLQEVVVYYSVEGRFYKKAVALHK